MFIQREEDVKECLNYYIKELETESIESVTEERADQLRYVAIACQIILNSTSLFKVMLDAFDEERLP